MSIKIEIQNNMEVFSGMFNMSLSSDSSNDTGADSVSFHQVLAVSLMLMILAYELRLVKVRTRP